ncbi:MAG: glycine cleavage system aminomethyltransferase GcvT [Isosphaeraceae bacterium]|nr:glycine cleavage system aminomethyltransferase GcvT [Isosphaeraceae bacterium]
MAGEMLHKTPLHDWHQAHGGRLVEFGGWSMPVQYTSIIEEHQAVRQRVGLFDISHMGRLLFRGTGACAWLESATTNHVARLAENQIQYSLMVNEAGGILDDILVYRLPEGLFAIVCNASNRDKVIGQLERLRDDRDAALIDQTFETAMIAVQGPRALETLGRVFEAESPLSAVKYYHQVEGTILGAHAWASRTGYTGEDGFEIIVPRQAAERAWMALLDAGREFGIAPCGLGARDTLRFEAAMPLYGHELDETINPYAAGLGWAVKLNKGDFVGRAALEHLKANPGKARVGLALEGKRIARQGAIVKRNGQPIGVVTSGTFAPTLSRSLAMALVDPTCSAEGTPLTIDIRGHDEPARVVTLPFYRRVGH